tara:strand:+ start:213 stop:1379 length:1167 start_codon:yes stop_codon:yes gene_type:complete
MAYYFIFPQKDATIYSHPDRTKLNTGHDEILEIVKEKGSSDQRYYPSRALIQFSNEDIKDTISNKIGSPIFNSGINDGNTQVDLQLFTTQHQNLAPTLNLEVFAISQSWNEGTGRFSNLPTSSNGCSWIFTDNDINKTQWFTSSFAPGTTGSINALGITQGGGSWYTGSGFQGSQQFLQGDVLDTNINVTEIVQKFSASLFANTTYPSGIPNNGFIIKNPDSVETDTSRSMGELKYFSVDSHTIYPPRLAFKWDDSVHSSQSLAKQKGELSVSLYRNREEYNQNDEAIFRVHVRDKYPTRQFTSSSNFLNVGYFTTSSFYSIRDAHTEQEIIPFDNKFTKLSADSDGMFFKIFMKGLQPERYYRVLFKHTNNEGTKVYDSNYHFKVVR